MDATQPLTPAEARQIVRRAEEIQAAEGLSNAAVGRILGCSSSVWSQLRHAKYSGDAEEYLRRARSWLDGRLLRNDTPETAYVETSIGRAIHAVCTRAWRCPTIGLVLTRSGMGKTAALLEYARKGGHRCVYLQAGQMLASRGALLVELAERLDVSTTGLSVASLYRAVRKRLAGLYAGGAADSPLILIDEATTLHPATLNMLRNLHDDPACRPGIVLADTWRMDRTLRSRRQDALLGGFEQLTSRGGAQYRLAAGRKVAARDVAAVAGSIVTSLGRERPLPAPAVQYLATLAQADGGLRNVQHRLQAAHDVAQAAGAKPRYSVRELDFVAPLVGGTCRLDHAEPPFPQRTRRSA